MLKMIQTIDFYQGWGWSRSRFKKSEWDDFKEAVNQDENFIIKEEGIKVIFLKEGYKYHWEYYDYRQDRDEFNPSESPFPDLSKYNEIISRYNSPKWIFFHELDI